MTISDPSLRIEKLLGGGSFGQVFKATDTRLDRTVAVKVLHASLTGEAIKRFHREAKALAAISHPNVLKVYATGVLNNGRPFITMEYIEGESLSSAIQSSEAGISAEESITYFIQIARGLAHCHENGLIHRDVKPENILLERKDDGSIRVRIIDFGLVRLYDNFENWEEYTAHLTRTGMTVGTPAYMSPEQCMGKKLDSRSDIYSLGCTMYHALYGQLPFVGRDHVHVASKHLSETPCIPELQSSKSMMATDLALVVMKCLQKDPDNRYATMSELASDLEKIKAGCRPDELVVLNKPIPDEQKMVIPALQQGFDLRFVLTFGILMIALVVLAVWIIKPAAVFVAFMLASGLVICMVCVELLENHPRFKQIQQLHGQKKPNDSRDEAI